MYIYMYIINVTLKIGANLEFAPATLFILII